MGLAGPSGAAPAREKNKTADFPSFYFSLPQLILRRDFRADVSSGATRNRNPERSPSPLWPIAAANINRFSQSGPRLSVHSAFALLRPLTQDNGSPATNQATTSMSSINVLGGDGGYNAIDPGAT